jgi:hypothetical protein
MELPNLSTLLHLIAALLFGILGWREADAGKRALMFTAAALFGLAAVIQLVTRSGM